MARVLLDANILIDFVERKKEKIRFDLAEDEIFISALSVHILLYITKRKVSDEKLHQAIESFALIPLDESIIKKAFEGPTDDFEDNVQLHSAAEGECDVFLTEDKKLLDMKFFGKTEVKPSLSLHSSAG